MPSNFQRLLRSPLARRVVIRITPEIPATGLAGLVALESAMAQILASAPLATRA